MASNPGIHPRHDFIVLNTRPGVIDGLLNLGNRAARVIEVQGFNWNLTLNSCVTLNS